MAPSQTYLILIKDGRLALAVAGALEERLAQDGHRALALVPRDELGLADAVYEERMAALAARQSGLVPVSGPPHIVALYEDGLLQQLQSLGLAGYVGVRDTQDWRILRWGSDGGAMLLPVASAGDLVAAVAEHTPWPCEPRPAPALRRAGAHRARRAPATALSRRVAAAGIAGIAGPMLLAGMPASASALQAPAHNGAADRGVISAVETEYMYLPAGDFGGGGGGGGFGGSSGAGTSGGGFTSSPSGGATGGGSSPGGGATSPSPGGGAISPSPGGGAISPSPGGGATNPGSTNSPGSTTSPTGTTSPNGSTCPGGTSPAPAPPAPITPASTTGGYHFDYQLAGTNGLTPQQAWTQVQGQLSTLFPFTGLSNNPQAGTTATLGSSTVPIPGAPVQVVAVGNNGFELESLPGHPEGAGRFITFIFQSAPNGGLQLDVSAGGPESGLSSVPLLNNVLANTFWGSFANNLDGALKGTGSGFNGFGGGSSGGAGAGGSWGDPSSSSGSTTGSPAPSSPPSSPAPPQGSGGQTGCTTNSASGNGGTTTPASGGSGSGGTTTAASGSGGSGSTAPSAPGGSAGSSTTAAGGSGAGGITGGGFTGGGGGGGSGGGGDFGLMMDAL
jgi:hypothetical protein